MILVLLNLFRRFELNFFEKVYVVYHAKKLLQLLPVDNIDDTKKIYLGIPILAMSKLSMLTVPN